MSNTASKVLRQCMGLRKNESFLVITDRELFPLAGEFFSAAQKITPKSRLVTVDIPEVNGAEPHPDVAVMMRKHDVSLLITSKSLSHTRARKQASRSGARIASMPGLTRGMFSTALRENPQKLHSINSKLLKALSGKKAITITTRAGTRMAFNVKGREWLADSGAYTKKGAFGNLPAGEVFIAPVEGTAEGALVIDRSIDMGKEGTAGTSLIMRFFKGMLVGLSGGAEARRLASLVKDDRYRNVAELGIGTNSRARITGNVLEDEKVLGTAHIALGNNIHFGGKVDVPFHVDSVVARPTIIADGKAIMKEGRFMKGIL